MQARACSNKITRGGAVHCGQSRIEIFSPLILSYTLFLVILAALLLSREVTMSEPDQGVLSDSDYLKLILDARVYDVAVETPLTFARNLSAKLNNKIYLKREDLQPVFSFKCRGAFNKISQLTQQERDRGVICASAGCSFISFIQFIVTQSASPTDSQSSYPILSSSRKPCPRCGIGC